MLGGKRNPGSHPWILLQVGLFQTLSLEEWSCWWRRGTTSTSRGPSSYSTFRQLDHQTGPSLVCMLRIRTTFFGSGSDLDVWKQILIKNLTFELIWLIWIKNVLVKFKKCKLFNKYVFLIYYIKFSFYTFFGRNRIQTIVSDPGKRFGSATLAAGIGRIIPGLAQIPDRTGTYCRLKIVKTTIRYLIFFSTSFKA